MPRTVTITLQDGSQHTYQNVPDNVTPDQVNTRAASEFGQGVTNIDGGNGAAAAAPDPRDSTIMQRLESSIPMRALQGVIDPIGGGIQALAHGAEWLGKFNPLPKMDIPGTAPATTASDIDNLLKSDEQRYQASRKATGQNGLDVSRIAGNIASPVNYVLPEIAPLRGAGLAAKAFNTTLPAINGAINGAALASLQPVTDGGDFGSEKLAQAELGAAGGAALPVLSGVAKIGGKVALGLLGETTGAGATSLRNAFQAGKQGGDAATAFSDAMRGNTSWMQAVDDAKAALGNLRAAKSKAYQEGMAGVSGDAAVLSFDPIDQAMSDASKIKTFAGKSGTGPVQDLSAKTADARKEVQAAIDNWKALDPAEYHTPAGFDALKQQIGDIKDSYQYGTPQWRVASDAYNSVRKAIADQAPVYNKTMADYSAASDEIAAIEKELSLGKKVNPNTALRKLQSVMRDNANTSWGARANYADRLSEAGAPNLLPKLAGQALSTPIPRGLAKYGDAIAAVPLLVHNPLTAPALLAASPRAMGEAAFAAGNVARGATNLRAAVPFQLPALPPGILGAGFPQLFANTAVQGAQ